MKCRICGNEENNKTYNVSEMMLKIYDVFQYFQCYSCNCLQITEYPSVMSIYYPINYYSYGTDIASRSGIKKFLFAMRDNHAVFGKGFVGKIINIMFPNAGLGLKSLHALPLTKDMKILDIGCGAGKLLYSLSNLGFKNLLGVDPFIEKNIAYENGLQIIKDEISNVRNLWDIVMLHHSFEHMPFQVQSLKTISKLLAPNGHCVIRIPISSSYAWEHYGVNWVQLDAPRHFYLHSVDSMKILANRVGMEVYNVAFDSTPYQFTENEQYRKVILSQNKSSNSDFYLKKQIRNFANQVALTQRAKQLNEIKKGDQAIFYLRNL